jgi:uncharacterized protein (DUF2147 family)
MRSLLFFCNIFILCFQTERIRAQEVPPKEKICGKWESTAKNLRIQITLDHNQYQANIIWFKNTDGKPMDYWTDVNNPDRRLRGRKLLGMSILTGLQFNPASNSWENGIVYDAKHGREWSASAYIGKKGQLHVRGYWHFKFIGKTMDFIRIGR